MSYCFLCLLHTLTYHWQCRSCKGESLLGVYACDANEAELLGVVGRQLAVGSIEGTGHHVPEALKAVLGNGHGVLGTGLLVPPQGCQLRPERSENKGV